MNLTPKQLEVVESVSGHYVVLAGPGCGKTRTIIEKIAYLFKRGVIPEPFSVLALTFTDAAARVMRSRLRDRGFNEWPRVWVGTFHSFGHYVLSSYGSNVGVREDFEIIEDDVRNEIIKQSINAHSFSLRVWDERDRIDRMKRSGIYPGQGDERLPDDARVVYQEYQKELERKGLIDLGDLVALSVRLFRDSDFVRRAYTGSFKYVIVDEFQDTDRQQLELVRILAEPAIGSTVVGDDDQSIFGWRGALRENVSRIKAILNSKEIVMGANFRSDQVIVEAAEKVIGEDLSRAKKDLISVSPDRGRLFKRGFDSPAEEAEAIASWIEGISRGGQVEDLGEIAVITRVHNRAEHALESLAKRGIPWFDRSRLKFRDSWETALALSALVLACDPGSSLYLHRVMKAVEDGGLAYLLGGEDALNVAVEMAEALKKDHLPVADPEHCLEILETAGIPDMVDKACSGSSDRKRRLKNVAALLADVVELSHDGLSLAATVERLSNLGAVQILSGHAAKGTEFDVVFLAGLEDDIIPFYRAHGDADALAEERRIFYVGLTRARKACYMTYAMHRPVRDWTKDTAPSRFLERIPAEYFSELPSAG